MEKCQVWTNKGIHYNAVKSAANYHAGSLFCKVNIHRLFTGEESTCVERLILVFKIFCDIAPKLLKPIFQALPWGPPVLWLGSFAQPGSLLVVLGYQPWLSYQSDAAPTAHSGAHFHRWWCHDYHTFLRNSLHFSFPESQQPPSCILNALWQQKLPCRNACFPHSWVSFYQVVP